MDEDLSIVETENINSDVVDKRLKEIKPDLILDHGTSIVKDDILANAPLALNLHWGLSPYYRGTHCTNWALINWDPYNIGVTIHKLTKNIDGGNILAQERAKITSNDTVKSINMQLTYLGTELIVQAINKLKNGKQLGYAGQDFSLGYLFLNRQWNPLLNEYLQQIQQEQVMELMLKKPARSEKLPIVEMK